LEEPDNKTRWEAIPAAFLFGARVCDPQQLRQIEIFESFGSIWDFYPLRLTEPRSDEIQPERGESNFRRVFIWLSREVSGN
jgi:hypothetical protein